MLAVGLAAALGSAILLSYQIIPSWARISIFFVGLAVVPLVWLLGRLRRRGPAADPAGPDPQPDRPTTKQRLKESINIVAVVVTLFQLPDAAETFFGSKPDPDCGVLDGRQVDQVDLTRIDQRVDPPLTFATSIRYGLEMGGNGRLTIASAGVINGEAPAGQSIYLVGSAQRDSVDTFGTRVREERYFPAYELESGCWKVPRHPIAYEGACGIEFRYFITLVPDRTADEFAKYVKNHAGGYSGPNHGFGTKTLRDEFGADLLAYWRVPTRYSQACKDAKYVTPPTAAT
ncbi:hypothetical protein [Catellatospora vulcania]|uniref:hypothetical protein n=1 Tax=Catellatospora vulcania TaxID=1460450 RepID=UPI0012D478C0|nr:hypothetical protein [Catellatospora vulcania]